MTAHLPDSVAPEFLRVWRKKRIRSVLIWSPVIFVVVWVALVALLFWRGHGLVHLVGKSLPTERAWLVVLLGPVPIAFVGAVICCYAMIRQCRAVAVPFCGSCRRADHSLATTCEVCGKPLAESRSYVYLSYEDEKQLAAFFGLHDEESEERV